MASGVAGSLVVEDAAHSTLNLIVGGNMAVIPWLGPEFSCQKRVKSAPGHNPVYKPEIQVDFWYK